MLQASLHNKNCHEDNLTSSSLGILQFLPDELFLRVLKGACGNQSSFPSDFGGILSFSFWPKLSANGTYNSLSVEPDLWIQTEQYHILIEVKKSDDGYGYAQKKDQWFNEIAALRNEINDDVKEIFLIALGGNDNLKDSIVTINQETYQVHTASWFNLLDTLIAMQNDLIQNQGPNNLIRIIDVCIRGLSKYGYFQCTWFESMSPSEISHASLNTLKLHWNIEKHCNLFSLVYSKKEYSNIKISDIWTIW